MITIHIATYSVIRLLPNFIKNVTATLGDLKDEEKKKKSSRSAKVDNVIQCNT